MVEIDYQCFETASLIVKADTGVSYDLQHGGFACNHTSVVGYVYTSCSIFYKKLSGLVREYPWGLPEAVKDKIEDFLVDEPHYVMPKFISVDRGTLEESYVCCQVEVVVSGKAKVVDAVLTWENSD
ncbi:hypothetical protein D3C85_1202590 [compost metagenome]